MKYLLFSDLHQDSDGFSKLKQFSSTDTFVKICLGDIINAADPGSEDYFMQVADFADEILLGNHEGVLTGACSTTVFNARVGKQITETKRMLENTKPQYLAHLAQLSKDKRQDDWAMTHASFNPNSPWHHIRYTEDVQVEEAFMPARVCFYAHGHVPFIAWKENSYWYYDRQVYGQSFVIDTGKPYIIDCGSVLGSREMREKEKTCLCFDDERQTVTFINLAEL